LQRRSRLPIRVTLEHPVPSVATSPPSISLPDTGRTDDTEAEDDPRGGARLYSRLENKEPQGAGSTSPLAAHRAGAGRLPTGGHGQGPTSEDDRSVSSWIPRAVERELEKSRRGQCCRGQCVSADLSAHTRPLEAVNTLPAKL